MNLNPHKLSFLFAWMGIKFFFIAIILFFIDINLWIGGVVLSILFILYDLWRFKKENYTIDDEKIIRHYWDWFSDNSIEVFYRRIVEVKLTLPFLQHLFFKTGNIKIETAWGGDVITILNISNPKQVYDKILITMKHAGYNLWEWDLVIETKPSLLWVIWEVLDKFINIQTFYIAFVIYSIFKSEPQLIYDVIWGIWSIILWFVLLYTVVLFVITYMDLKKRIYKLYTDRIEYYEWFLTKHHAVIPIEAVSDIENKQSFLSRILWIHDIVVSSKWSTNYIVFKNMLNWEKFIESVKYIKDQITKNTFEEKTENKENKEKVITHKQRIEGLINYDNSYTAEFKMSTKKVLIPILISIIFISIFIPILFIIISMPIKKAFNVLPYFITPFFIFLIARLVQTIFTKYKIHSSSVEYTFDFISKKYANFNVENITNIVFVQSIIDKILWTWSIKFYSIWSSIALTFKDINFSDELKTNILKKVWIYDEKVVKEIPANFNLKNFIYSNLPTVIIILLFLLFLWFISIFAGKTDKISILSIIWIVITLCVASYIYVYYLYSPKFYSAKIRQNYIELKKWIFVSTHSYSLIRNIKWITSTKFPFTNVWNLSFDIAWEIRQIRNKSYVNVSNSIKMYYVNKVFLYHDAIDKYINNGNLNTETIIFTKPVLINYVLPITIVRILTLLMWLLFLIYLLQDLLI